AVLRRNRLRAGQSHQRIAVCRRQVHAVAKQLFHSETRVLRREFSSAREDACNARRLDAGPAVLEFLGERFEQLWRGEHTADLVSRPEPRYPLLDYMRLVLLQRGELSPLDQLDHPARVEVNTKTNTAAVLTQVLDRQPQPARP